MVSQHCQLECELDSADFERVSEHLGRVMHVEKFKCKEETGGEIF